MRKRSQLAALGALCSGWFVSLGSLQAGGVTLITHGFNSSVGPWILPMAGEMEAYTGSAAGESTCYILEVTSTSGSATADWQSGVKPNLSDSGEIFIKLDWSALAGLFQASTQQVAAVAVNALMDPALISTDTGGRPLVELPLHLIGHSRGASLVTEMARLLGAQGIWVDQVTTLDPVPLGFNGDAAVRNWANVFYADNYWEDSDSNGLLHGDPLSGAYNRYLTSFSGGNGSDHSDVHLWYHGTIDLSSPTSSAEAEITSSMRSSWWTVDEDEGAEAGFRFSRLGGGDRLSSFQPAGADAVVDGVNGIWDLGAGLASNRMALPAKRGLWPNVIRVLRTDAGTVSEGDDFDLTAYIQAGADALGAVTLTILLDPDSNPWNGNEIAINGGVFPTTGPEGVTELALAPGTAGVPAGSYAIALQIDDGSRTRFLYAAESLEVVAPFPPPTIDGPTVRIEAGQMTFSVLGAVGQTVEVRASIDASNWSTVATETLSAATWQFSDSQTASFPKRFYQVRQMP